MDMPGNYLNPMGLGYFNELFMAMYLGNYEGNIDVHKYYIKPFSYLGGRDAL